GRAYLIMTTVFSNSAVDDDARRGMLYDGELFVYSATPSSLALVRLAQGLIEEAFGDRDPELAQFDMAVEDYAGLLADLKPRFIHHPTARSCCRRSSRSWAATSTAPTSTSPGCGPRPPTPT